VLYLAIVAGLLFLGVFGDTTWAFGLALLTTLPISLPAFFVFYVGGVMLFGSGEWGVVANVVALVFWLGVAAGDVVLVRMVLVSRRSPAPLVNDAI
jgi:hypothetical protein